MFRYIVIGLVVIVAAVLLFGIQRREGFALDKPDPNWECPQRVHRGPDGRIHVHPGKRSFPTMSQYVGFLSGLYARGATCLAPEVKEKREPVLGIMGGLGVGAEPPSAFNRQGTTRTVFETENTEETSVKTPINKLDDYEYTRIEQSERAERNALSKAVKNELMEGRALDWANLPFNSEARAFAEDTFIAGRMEDMYRDPKTGVFFKNMSGRGILPPDVEAEKMREAKILSSYRPTDFTKHTIDSKTESVARLVNDMYKSDPNWEPVVSKTGENKWEVTELRAKPRKETYQDAQAVSLATAEATGLAQPPVSVDIADRLRDDPYFDKSGVGDRDNNKFWNYKDFNKWTPGLERMFAPTLDNKEWY
jgi:hypothetical protein